MITFDSLNLDVYMKIELKKIAIVMLVLAAGSANAESGVAVKLLGPGILKHANADSAPIVNPGDAAWVCRGVPNNFGCLGEMTPKREWRNDGGVAAVGVEFSKAVEDNPSVRNVYFAQLISEVNNKIGIQGGAGRSWALTDTGSPWVFAVGVGGGIWYKAVVSDAQVLGNSRVCYTPQQIDLYQVRQPPCTDFNQGMTKIETSTIDMRTVAYVQPFADLQHKSGFGLRLSLSPLILDNAVKSTPTVFIQATYQIGK